MSGINEKVYVTKSFLPPQEDYQRLLKKAWDSSWITNYGLLLQELENKLKEYLEVPRLIPTTNGTLPLQIAIKSLDIKGEVITTPFSYVATCSAIVWENCTPVFVDINPDYLTIDESKIEAAITAQTSAILATHVFGNPCNIEAVEAIAKKYNLKVIYDAAHCFGVKYKDKSIFNYGDASTCSFHATKLFHTGEGGAIFCNSEELHQKCFFHHNFGHNGPEKFHGLGINAKMSELQAAMGLSVLPYMDEIITNRKEICEEYEKVLKGKAQLLRYREGTSRNYSYFPIIFSDEEALLNAKAALEQIQVFPRRYFFPSLNKLPYVKSNEMKVSESVSKRILCLPLFYKMDKALIKKISNAISEVL